MEEKVKRGQKLVTLINEDAKLAFNLAKAQLDRQNRSNLSLFQIITSETISR